MLFVLALVGAVLSGWLPAISAAMNAGQATGMHAMHQTDGEDGKSKPVAHPVACSACFAIETARLEPLNRSLDISSRVSATMPQLAGLALRPLNPPPRS